MNVLKFTMHDHHIRCFSETDGRWSWSVEGIAVNGGWCQLTGGFAATLQNAIRDAYFYISERLEA